MMLSVSMLRASGSLQCRAIYSLSSSVRLSTSDAAQASGSLGNARAPTHVSVPPHNLTGARVVHNTTPVNDSRQSERRKKSESITKALAHTLHPSQFFRTEVFPLLSTMKNKIEYFEYCPRILTF